jgi:lon-related putative ATP-dependent protease
VVLENPIEAGAPSEHPEDDLHGEIAIRRRHGTIAGIGQKTRRLPAALFHPAQDLESSASSERHEPAGGHGVRLSPTMTVPNEVPIEKLRYRCSPDAFSFETTADLDLGFDIIGQERAIKAIRLGLAIESRGFNIVVQGLTGTGKETTVKSILERVARRTSEAKDICYVHDFDDPDGPKVLYLPAGDGRRLRLEMDSFVSYLVRALPAAFESDEFKKRQEQILETEGEKGRTIVHDFEERIKKENFVLAEVRRGAATRNEAAPIVDGKPRTGEELEQMLAEGTVSREEFERLDQLRQQLGEELEEVLKHARDTERLVGEAMKALAYGFAAEIVNPRIAELKARYPGERTGRFLEQVRHHLLDNLDDFAHKPDPSSEAAGIAALIGGARDPHLHYRVNLLVDNSKTERAPIVVETHPTYKNLFGTIERSWDRSGQTYTDFTRIKAGSLLRAVGGYLVLSFSEILSEPGVYLSLKRTLKSGKVDIQGSDPAYLFTGTALKPEPIDVELKVVLIADNHSYQIFYQYDPDFRKVFKIKADFDTVMERNADSIARYASFIARVSERENLLPFDRTAAAAVVEEGVRLAGRQGKLSTRFSDVADLLREASYWAKEEGEQVVTAASVDRAVRESIERRNLVETRIADMIREGILLIATDGARVGELNGLSVYDVGDYRFGRPTKITASVAAGRAGIINIEREADLSGKSHNKGMLILGGYFRARFAQKVPLALSASLAFEQNYGGVDGDSASSTELYALLSALSRVPLRQDIAVTGSVNQKGEIQAIGGVNEKIEGFFDTCRAFGLTGRQGVLIPQSNVPDLMLRKDVVEAVAERRFRIFTAATVEEGIEVLTGVEAGSPNEEGEYEGDTLFALVQRRLAKMAKDARDALKADREEPRNGATASGQASP